MICDINSPLLCFCYLSGDKKEFLLVENIFWTNNNVACYKQKAKQIRNFVLAVMRI